MLVTFSNGEASNTSMLRNEWIPPLHIETWRVSKYIENNIIELWYATYTYNKLQAIPETTFKPKIDAY